MTPVSAMPLDTLDGEAINALRELMTDDEGELRDIVQMFLSDATTRVKAARGATEPAPLGTELHTLRGMSAAVGGQRLAALCAEAEGYAWRADLASARVLMAPIERELDHLRAALHSEIGL